MPVRSAVAFADLWTLARASSGWAWSADGTLTEYAANLPRLDFDPATLAFQGMRIEAAIENVMANGRMDGGVAGSPGTLPTGMTVNLVGGVSRSIAGIGIEAGIPYMDIRFAGTPTGTGNMRVSFRPSTGAPALVGETWTAQHAVRLAAGSMTNVGAVTRSVVETDGAGAQLGLTSTNLTVAAGDLRGAIGTTSRTMASASSANVQSAMLIGVTNTLAIDVTFRVAVLGLWKAAQVPSPSYAPAGSPAIHTRQADDIQAAAPAGWFNGAAGTFAVDFMPGQSSAPGERGLLGLSDGTANNTVDLRILAASNVVRLTVVSGGVTTVAALDTAAATALVRNTLRLSYGPAGWLLSLNGAAPVTAAAAMPPGISVVRLGRKAGSADYLQGWLGPRVQWFGRQYTDVVADDGFTIRMR